MDIKNKALVLVYSVASQRGAKDNVLLMAPSEATESYSMPAQEIILTVEDIKRLYAMVAEGAEGLS